MAYCALTDQCEAEGIEAAQSLAMRYYRQALDLADQAGEPQLLFTLYLDMGDEAQAERYMVEAKEVCERAGLDPDSFVVLPFLG